jgi:hypothetical protein
MAPDPIPICFPARPADPRGQHNVLVLVTTNLTTVPQQSEPQAVRAPDVVVTPLHHRALVSQHG